MSLVIARDEKVFVVVNAEYLEPEEATLLASRIRNAAFKASSQKFKRVVGEVAKDVLGRRK